MAAVTAAIPRTDPPMVVSDSFAKDAILAWFRGEFAAANAIIDALCSHLAAAASSSDEYDAVFAAIHRRRLNWIPVIQMQKYHSIADVTLELRKVTEKKTATAEEAEAESNGGGDDEKGKVEEEVTESVGNGEGEGEAQQSHEEYESPESEITDSGGGNIIADGIIWLLTSRDWFHLNGILPRACGLPSQWGWVGLVGF